MLFIVSEFVMRIKIKNQMQYPTFGISKIRFMSSVFVQEEKIINVRCFVLSMILTFFLLSRWQISYVSFTGVRVYYRWQVANVGNQKEETQNAPRALAFGGK